jgi:DNA-binding Lrp family transcriptional regulator
MRYLQQRQDSEKVKLDVKDIKILALLCNNARTPLTQLAKKVGLSRDAISYRIKNYEKKGLIQGYRTMINVAKLGYNNYHLFIKLSNPSEEIEKSILHKIRDLPFIRAILKFSGTYDLEIALVAKDLAELDKNIVTITSNCGGFIQDYDLLTFSKFYVSRTMPRSFSEKIEDSLMENKDYIQDKKDIAILKLISEDALLPLYEIGDKIKLSADAVAYRIKKMRESKIINKYIPVVNYNSLDYSMYTALFNISSLDEKKEKKLRELLIADKNALWAVKMIGKFNILAYFLVKNIDELQGSISGIRSLFPGEINHHEVLIAYEEYKYTYFPKGLF